MAFVDLFSRCIRFYEYKTPTDALAGYLKIVTGYFAVQGLISPALHLDLSPQEPSFSAPELQLSGSAGAFDNLRVLLASKQEENYESALDALFGEPELYSVSCLVTTGRDKMKRPTAGILVQVDWEDRARLPAAAFFYLSEPGVFVCDDPEDKLPPWLIEHEPVEAYVKRSLDRNGKRAIFGRRPRVSSTRLSRNLDKGDEK